MKHCMGFSLSFHPSILCLLSFRLFQSVANSCLGPAAAQKILANAAAAHQQRFAAQAAAASQGTVARSSSQSGQ